MGRGSSFVRLGKANFEVILLDHFEQRFLGFLDGLLVALQEAFVSLDLFQLEILQVLGLSKAPTRPAIGVEFVAGEVRRLHH